MKAAVYRLVSVGVAGMLALAAQAVCQESQPVVQSEAGESPEIAAERTRLEELAQNEDGAFAMDAAHRLWGHFRAKGNDAKAAEWKARFIELLIKRAEDGETPAMVTLGRAYAVGGDFVGQDLAEARKWFERAAEAGDADSQYQVATFYLTGSGGPQDIDKASQWFQRALGIMMAKAKHRDAKAAFWVGQMYFNGWGAEVDYKVAFEYFLRAAELGDLRSQSLVGFLYREGRGVEASEEKAVEWFRKAAERGDVGAIMEVGLAYREGKGVPKDSQVAREWFLKGAAQRDLYALRTLAIMYADGELGEKDEQQAIEYFVKSADAGDVYSSIEAAHLLKGSDPDKAYGLIKRAADQYRSPAAVYELALLEKERGSKDLSAKLMRQSAESGYSEAMMDLGMMHLIPFSGVTWNPRISYYWWSIADKAGDEDALGRMRWLLWGGGGGMLVILIIAVLLLNVAIKKRLAAQEGGDVAPGHDK